MEKKNKRALIIIASAVVLLTVITVAYAYFVATVSVPKQQVVTAETGTLRLIMNDGNAGWSEVWDFGESKSKTLTLQNTGSLPVTVDLYWKNLVNTFTTGSMAYSLKQTTDDATPVETYLVGSASTFENVPTSATSVSTNKIAEQITVPANKTYTYTLTIKLVDSETVDQTADLNAEFYTEFDIKESVPKNYVVSNITMELGQRIPSGVNVRNSASAAMADWAEITGIENDTKQIYLRHELNSSGEITESYVEFIVTPEMVAENPGMVAGTYIIGNTASDNVSAVTTAFDYQNHPERCWGDDLSDSIYDFSCYVTGLSVTIHKDYWGDGAGSVKDDSNYGCWIYSEGNTRCQADN